MNYQLKRITTMSTYKVLQTFSHQGADYHEGEEVEIEDSKAEEIGSSYLGKVEGGEGSESSSRSPGNESGEDSASQTDAPPRGGEEGQA